MRPNNIAGDGGSGERVVCMMVVSVSIIFVFWGKIVIIELPIFLFEVSGAKNPQKRFFSKNKREMYFRGFQLKKLFAPTPFSMHKFD